ncbi:MAG: alpha/beta hydrolase family protein [Dehalococcoidia bacterium]
MKIQQQRRRDNQQWILDWVVKQTGRVINFEYDERDVPAYVKSYAQIPKAVGKVGKHRQEIAAAAEKAGHTRTALLGYFLAVRAYHTAQHTFFEDDNRLKIHYHSKLLECYVIRCADYPIERVEVPWEGVNIQCNLHLLPDRRRAPCVVFVPGMDMVKEQMPEPANNVFLQRGMHCITMDGPGQGMSNIRKIRVRDDNYERAASAVVDYLQTRPEVDPERIAVMGVSMGSFWGTRIAAYDQRLKAAAVAMSCFGDKTAIFEQSSPRFKQIFMYMAGMDDEEEFDRMAARMTTVGYASKVTCPYLIVTGEYDPLSPLEDVEEAFGEAAGPKEIWVLENDFHVNREPDNLGNVSNFNFMADWLAEALAGKFGPGHQRYVYVPQHTGIGPYVQAVAEYATVTP